MSDRMLEDTIARALSYLNESQTAVEDRAKEIESLVNGFEVDKGLEDGALEDQGVNLDDLLDDRLVRQQRSNPGPSLGQHHVGNLDQLSANLKDASKGVIVDTTLSDYAK